MKLVSHLLLASLIGLSTAPAHAGQAWLMRRNVLYIYPSAAGFAFQLDGERVNIGSTCESNRMTIPISASNYDALVSSLTMAFATGKLVDANYDDTTTTQCEMVVNRVVVYR